MPCTEIAGLKKSKTLLLLMTLSVLLFGLADPSDITPLVGRLLPAGPMLLFEMVLPVFAPPVDVLIRTVPLAAVELPVDEPRTEQFVTVLVAAPLMKRIVLVVAPVSALEMVNELLPVFNPLMVTLLAPLRLVNAPATEPETVLAPTGLTVSVVQPPLFKLFAPFSVRTSDM